MREAKKAEELRALKKVKPGNSHELRETSGEPEMDESPSAERIPKRKLPRESSVEVDPETGEILVDYDSDQINSDDSRESCSPNQLVVDRVWSTSLTAENSQDGYDIVPVPIHHILHGAVTKQQIEAYGVDKAFVKNLLGVYCRRKTDEDVTINF